MSNWQRLLGQKSLCHVGREGGEGGVRWLKVLKNVVVVIAIVDVIVCMSVLPVNS